jgi:DnaK suppressor protein
MAILTGTPLTRAELAQLKGTIEQRIHVLEEEIREDARRIRRESPAEVAGPTPDAGDASIADLISDIGSAELERDFHELLALEAALARMNKGEYGACADCGRDIGFPRLAVQPIALRCLECQQRYENTHATPGAPSL